MNEKNKNKKYFRILNGYPALSVVRYAVSGKKIGYLMVHRSYGTPVITEYCIRKPQNFGIKLSKPLRLVTWYIGVGLVHRYNGMLVPYRYSALRRFIPVGAV